MQEARPGKFLTGDKLTHCDLKAFWLLSFLQSGLLEGGYASDTVVHERAELHDMSCVLSRECR